MESGYDILWKCGARYSSSCLLLLEMFPQQHAAKRRLVGSCSFPKVEVRPLQSPGG